MKHLPGRAGAALFILLIGGTASGKPQKSAVPSSAAPSRGASSRGASSPGALTFHVNARFRYHAEEGEEMPGDSLDAKVIVQGQRARLETVVGGRPLVMIFAPPFLYKLLPAAKSGTRYRLSEVSKNPGLAGLNPQPWLREPQAIRAALAKLGARRVGEATMNGVPVEIWTAQKFMGRSGQVKAWLRRADALPLKLEMQSKALTATATWRDYQRLSAPQGASFSPPAGFRIREAD